MLDLDPFSEPHLGKLKKFVRRIGEDYTAIKSICLYDGTKQGREFVLLFEIQDIDTLEYREVRSYLLWANVDLFRDEDPPECIRDYEEKWWIEAKDINEEFPHILAFGDSGYELYNCNNSTTPTNKKRIASDDSERIQHFCNDALKLKYIDDFRLSQVFENDNQYEKLLPKLWDRYQLNKRGPKYPKVETVNDRIVSWNRLIARLTKGLVAGTTDSLEPIEYLKMYRFNRKTGDFERSIDHGTHLNLNELKEYFINQLEIPLPLMLFPPIEKTEKKNNNLIYQFTEKPEEYFPKLHIHMLKIQAERWVKKYHEAAIERVLLYSFSPLEIEGYILATEPSFKQLPRKYAVVFYINFKNKMHSMTPQEQLRFDGKGISGERPLEPYERLLVATKPNKRLSDNEQYHDLMTADFEDVYTHPCENDYHAEWNFIVKFKNSELDANIRTDEPCAVLWERIPSKKKTVKESKLINTNIQSTKYDTTQTTVNINNYNYYSEKSEKPSACQELKNKEPEKKTNSGGLFPISSDRNLEWKDITISFLSDVEMHIQFKEEGHGKNITRRFDHLGFGDGRKNNDVPIQAWHLFFHAAKEQKIPHLFENRRIVEAAVKTLRQKLRKLFPNIAEDPVPHNKKDSSYHFAFHFNPPA